MNSGSTRGRILHVAMLEPSGAEKGSSRFGSRSQNHAQPLRANVMRTNW